MIRHRARLHLHCRTPAMHTPTPIYVLRCLTPPPAACAAWWLHPFPALPRGGPPSRPAPQEHPHHAGHVRVPRPGAALGGLHPAALPPDADAAAEPVISRAQQAEHEEPGHRNRYSGIHPPAIGIASFRTCPPQGCGVWSVVHCKIQSVSCSDVHITPLAPKHCMHTMH